ncbi:PHD and RING finger domain-containing protein 1, variant 3 [Trebouxia sp. C0009 RCD-2024]
MVLAVETAAAAGDSDEDRITYATDDPEYREGGSDSGPSVLEELCCEFPKEHGCAMTVTKPQKPQPMRYTSCFVRRGIAKENWFQKLKAPMKYKASLMTCSKWLSLPMLKA